jgi:hypothetical protein
MRIHPHAAPTGVDVRDGRLVIVFLLSTALPGGSTYGDRRNPSSPFVEPGQYSPAVEMLSENSNSADAAISRLSLFGRCQNVSLEGISVSEVQRRRR